MQKIDFTQRRLQQRVQIRRKEAVKKSKRRMEQNIKKLNQYANRDQSLIETRLERIFQFVPESNRPQKSYNLSQITAVFDYLIPVIIKPSNQLLSIWILEALEQFLILKQEQCSIRIIEYAIDFIKQNKYDSLTGFNQYKRSFLGFLKQLTFINEETQISQQKCQLIQELKRLLLKWCRGQHSLDVITNCIKEVPNIIQFKHIYEIIQHGISSDKQQLSKSSVSTLLALLQQADPDDVDAIHQYYPEIYQKLLRKAQNFEDTLNFQYMSAIQKLLSTYATIVLGIIRMGLGQLLEDFFSSNSNKIYSGGLMIVNDLVYFKKEEIGRYLTNNNLFGMWNKISSLHRSQMYQEVVYVYSIFSGFLSNFGEQLIQSLLTIIEDYNSIFKLIEAAFTIHRDFEEIVFRTIEIIKSILYYIRGGNLGRVFLKELIHRDLVKYIGNCIIEYQGAVSTMANQIMQIVQYSGLLENN